MRKILFLLLLWLYPIFSFGAVNECLTDVYFANGILTNEKNATANTLLLERSIRKKFYGGSEDKMYKYIGKVKAIYPDSWTQTYQDNGSIEVKAEIHDSKMGKIPITIEIMYADGDQNGGGRMLYVSSFH